MPIDLDSFSLNYLMLTLVFKHFMFGKIKRLQDCRHHTYWKQLYMAVTRILQGSSHLSSVLKIVATFLQFFFNSKDYMVGIPKTLSQPKTFQRLYRNQPFCKFLADFSKTIWQPTLYLSRPFYRFLKQEFPLMLWFSCFDSHGRIAGYWSRTANIFSNALILQIFSIKSKTDVNDSWRVIPVFPQHFPASVYFPFSFCCRRN